MRLTDLCEALKISRPRVDQWINLRAFRAPARVENAMREWSTEDAVRVAAMAMLVDAGVDVQSAGAATQFDLPADGFLVLWTGFAPIVGLPENPPKMPIAGFWREVLRSHELPVFLCDPDVAGAYVVHVENLRKRVRVALNA